MLARSWSSRTGPGGAAWTSRAAVEDVGARPRGQKTAGPIRFMVEGEDGRDSRSYISDPPPPRPKMVPPP